MNATRLQLLKQLHEKKNQFVSGERLSEQLHVSRTAIWKHIEELKKQGYVIEAIRKQGYRLLDEPEGLSEPSLLLLLQTDWLGQQLYVYNQVASTQALAHELATDSASHGTVIVANEQTGGRGRLGRVWHSASGTGIWMSFIVHIDLPLMKVPQLTLLSSVAVLRALRSVSGCSLEIKWPNDVLCNGRKVAGILTELSAEADRTNYVVLGIGINVNQSQDEFPEEIHHIATSLASETGQQVDRNSCIAAILKEWEDLYLLYLEHGFKPIKTLWETHALSLGKQIVARTPQGKLEGLAKGITDDGVLLLEDNRGQIHYIYSADIAL